MPNKLLFISRWFPFPPDNGSKLRVYHLLRQLSSRYEIHLVSFTGDGEARPEAIEALQSICHSVDVVPYPGYRPTQLKALLGFFSSQPRSVVATHSLAMREIVAGLARKHLFDVVIASQIDMAPYALDVKAPVRILEELEISGYIDAINQQRTQVGRWRRLLTLVKTKRYFAKMAGRFDGVTVVSERELQEVGRISSEHTCIEVIPNGVELLEVPAGSAGPEPDSLIYTGAVTYSANMDAVRYFVEEIFPLVLKRRPQAKLYVTGKTGGLALTQPPFNLPGFKGRLVFTGYLPEIRQKVQESWVSIVPIRQGGGTRLKILESLAVGTPVVSTRKGAEGLNLIDGHDLLLADTPTMFAAQVVRLLEDPALRTSLGDQGRQAVAEQYDWDKIGLRLIDFLEHVRLEQRKI